MGSKKKQCPKCKQVEWLKYKGGLCKRCAIKGQCPRCQKDSPIYIKGHCKRCYHHVRIEKHLNQLQKQFIPFCDYNQHIFQLYINYICRYKLDDLHIKQAKILKESFEKQPLNPFLSWIDIYKASAEFKSMHGYDRRVGDPYIKIGTMLEELEVLPPRSDEKSIQINRLLSTFKHSILKIINAFVVMLKKTNRSQATIIKCLGVLRDANQWLCENKNNDLLTTHTTNIASYLDMLKGENSNSYVLGAYGYLNMFYKWCLKNKHLIHNPCLKITVNNDPPKITVCSEEQFEALFQFIKNPKSNPEQAFLLSLILFWGFRSGDLKFAKLEYSNNSLKIILRRKPLTCGNKHYNREQILSLPLTVPWFLELQKRFYNFWYSRYTNIKKNYPNPLLILPKKNKPITPLGNKPILNRIYEGTIEATGDKIPVRVLRQTCGYLYTIDNDASILSRLGWSQSFAFQYTWLPKVIFHQQDK